MHGSTTGGPMYFVEEAPTANKIRVDRGDNLLTAPSFTSTDLAVAPCSSPPSATQKGSGNQIQTNDSRILNAEWRDGRLVAAQAVGGQGDGLAHARWYDISSAGTPRLSQQGTVGVGSGANSYFPSIAINANGDLGMTYIQSSPTEYMSMYVTGQAAGDPAGTMQTPVVAKAGEIPYSSYDSAPYRAGDYSGITVDPVDGTTFWAANEYAKNITAAAKWGTAPAGFTVSGSTSGGDTTAPTVSVSSPAAGESVTAGSPYTIQWTATDNVGVSSVDLAYSLNGSGGPYTTIATGQANTGSYSWSVPAGITSSNAVVQVMARDAAGNLGTGLSGTFFIVAAPPVQNVTVTSITPNQMGVNTTQRVTISGSGFQSGAAVSFEGSRGPSPSASIVSVSSTQIIADVSTNKGAKTATWDVRVTNPDGSTGVLPQGFTITGGKIGHGPALAIIPGPSGNANPPFDFESPVAYEPMSGHPGNGNAVAATMFGMNADAMPPVVVVPSASDAPTTPAQVGKKGDRKPS